MLTTNFQMATQLAIFWSWSCSKTLREHHPSLKNVVQLLLEPNSRCLLKSYGVLNHSRGFSIEHKETIWWGKYQRITLHQNQHFESLCDTLIPVGDSVQRSVSYILNQRRNFYQHLIKHKKQNLCFISCLVSPTGNASEIW